jgi:hypothetical protein
MSVTFTSPNIHLDQPNGLKPFAGVNNGNTIVYGSVEALAEPHTSVQGNTMPGVYSLGFYVDNGPPNSNSIIERTLLEMDNVSDASTILFPTVYEGNSTMFHGQYIVTNCSTFIFPNIPSINTNGLTNVIENYWYTNILNGVNDSDPRVKILGVNFYGRLNQAA